MVELDRDFVTLFLQCHSICDRNTSTGVKRLRDSVSESTNVFEWYSRFRDRRDLVENDERGGHLNSNRTEVNTGDVAD